MREIKFRGFCNGEMRYPVKVHHYRNIDFYSNEGFHAPREDIIIMQFTGFHDSTGKEIYEGDILDCGQDPNAEVWWDEELGQFSISTYHATLSLCDNLRNAKIKGNKYENPELL